LRNATGAGRPERQADWVKRRVDALSFEQQQAMLETEFGGMN
jgi:hypothetical protein